MDAATVVLCCLLSHSRQPFALGVGLVPKVGEQDEEDGPINPDEVDEDGELVLAAGHEIILGDVDGDNHKLCLKERQSRKKLIGAGSRIPLETFQVKPTGFSPPLKRRSFIARHSQQQVAEKGISLKATCTLHSQHGCSPGAAN